MLVTVHNPWLLILAFFSSLSLRAGGVEGGVEKPACVLSISLSLALPSSLAQPLLFSMCNLKLICTTGYLTGATDTGSVLFLLKHSMELTLNLNKTTLN